MHEPEEQWSEITDRLLTLRAVFEGSPDGVRSSALFDEFLREHEYALALHVVCDVLLERRPAVIDREHLEAIRWLHEKMLIQDDCVELLERGVRPDRGRAG